MPRSTSAFVIFVLLGVTPLRQGFAQTAVVEMTASPWQVAETPNFVVYVQPRATTPEALAAKCETLRRQLQETWFGDPQADWPSRCEIVVHATVAAYRQALGAGSEHSSGCATIRIEPGRVISRRIDLRSDASEWLDSSLPHELTHVVVADRFTRRQIPRWADEGLAILSESTTKQKRRFSVMKGALAERAGFSAAELLSLTTYPPGPRLDAFYGQSASLVACLIERDSPEKFLQFVELSARQGPERALSSVYGWRTLVEFDQHWQSRMLFRDEPAELLATRLERIASDRLAD